MRKPVMLIVLLCLCMILPSGSGRAALPVDSPSASRASLKIDPRLRQQLTVAGSQPVRYLAILQEQADTSNDISPLHWAAKGQYVYDRLRATAERTQPVVVAALGSMTLAGTVSSYQSFWIVNALLVDGQASSVYQLAARADVRYLEAAPQYRVEPDAAQKSGPQHIAASEPGLNQINAPAVWAQGFRGQGITVGILDTGQQFDHPALVRQYRGTSILPGHDYNWFDADYGTTSPVDYYGHGTHVTGIIVGDDGAGNQIGVAPAANWIGCRGQADGTGSNDEMIKCAQFMLAPTRLDGSDARPELRPQVVNNSWGSNTSSGTDEGYRWAVVAWVNAGIFPAFSNGNSGPAAGTANAPGSYPESFAVGASGTGSDNLAGFSSRGPSPIDGGLKPQLTAPGIGVRSSYPNGSYASLSGTSMASPHVAGVVALLLAKNRGLTVSQLANVLTQTAYFDPVVMGVRPNNNYGWGRLDALAAVGSVANLNGLVSGLLSGGLSLRYVTASGGLGNYSTAVDPTGRFALRLPSGSYSVTASSFGYTSSQVIVAVSTGLTSTANLTLTAMPTYSASGQLLLNGSPVPAVFSFPAAPLTPITGTSFSLSLPVGTLLRARPLDLCVQPTSLSWATATSYTLTTAPKRDSYGYSCQVAPYNWITATNVITDWQGERSPDRDDGWHETTLPFAFNLYGSQHYTVGISTNGYLQFSGPPSFAEGGGHLPDRYQPNDALYPYWLDLILGQGDVYTSVLGTAPARRFVVEWRNVAKFFSGHVTFEAILAEGTNNVTYQYGTIEDGRSPSLYTVGLENQSGLDGLEFSFDVYNAVSRGVAIQFSSQPAATATPIATPTTPTATPTTFNATATATPTAPAGSPTLSVSPPTATALTGTASATAAASVTSTITTTATATATATACATSFSDVPTSNIFYSDIQFLACRGVISGYANPGGGFRFEPNSPTTRGQFAKILVGSFNLPLSSTGIITFSDVPPGYIFASYIYAAARAGAVVGLNPQQCAALAVLYPCFGPNLLISRIQVAASVGRVVHLPLYTPTTPTFADLNQASFGYQAVESLYHYAILSGQPCGGSQRCYLPNVSVRRDEFSKLIHRAVIATP